MKEMTYKTDTFGKFLKQARLDSGVGLRELSRLINKSAGYISDVERGRVPPPSGPRNEEKRLCYKT